MALTQTAHSVRIAALASMAGLALSLGGCQYLGLGSKEPSAGETEIAPSAYAPCLESYGSGVTSVVSTADGSRDFYVSNEMPPNVNKDSWTSSSRAVFEYDVNARRSRPIASTWDSEVMIPPYASPNPDPLKAAAVREVRIAEKLERIDASADGKRIVIGVSRKNLTGGLSTLYTGIVPGSGAPVSLRPGEGGGLTAIKINDDLNQEAVQTFSLSPDGKVLAAVVGDQGEIRSYEIETDKIFVYTLGTDNAIEVSNALPTPALNIGVDRKPALTGNGAQLVWSPDSKTIAYATNDGMSGYAVQLVDYTTGKPTLVHRFKDSTRPQIAWAPDAQSLYVVTTATNGVETFGNTTIQRLTAAKDGKAIGGQGLIKRLDNWRTVPAFVTLVGEDTLLFTWEKQLFRFRIKEGDLAKATFTPITERYPASVSVLPLPVYGSAAADRAVYAINDPAFGNRVGVYTHLTQDKCPVPTASK